MMRVTVQFTCDGCGQPIQPENDPPLMLLPCGWGVPHSSEMQKHGEQAVAHVCTRQCIGKYLAKVVDEMETRR